MMLKKEDATESQRAVIEALEIEYADPSGVAHFTTDRVEVGIPGFQAYDFIHGALIGE